MGSGFSQTSEVLLPQKESILPFHHAVNLYPAIAATQTIRHIRRDMLIEKKLEHFSFSPPSRKRIRPLGVTCASAFQNSSHHSQPLPPRFLPETPSHN